MSDIEELRQRYFPPKPPGLRLLFVAESAPRTEFFYTGVGVLYDAMRPAFRNSYGDQDDFLRAFQEKGFWLDDVVRRRGLRIREETQEVVEGVNRIASLIARERPCVVASVVRRAESGSEGRALRAVMKSGEQPLFFSLPFPRSGGNRWFFVAYLGYIFRLFDSLCRSKTETRNA
jgi:hypothetical protein